MLYGLLIQHTSKRTFNTSYTHFQFSIYYLLQNILFCFIFCFYIYLQIRVWIGNCWLKYFLNNALVRVFFLSTDISALQSPWYTCYKLKPCPNAHNNNKPKYTIYYTVHTISPVMTGHRTSLILLFWHKTKEIVWKNLLECTLQCTRYTDTDYWYSHS